MLEALEHEVYGKRKGRVSDDQIVLSELHAQIVPDDHIVGQLCQLIAFLLADLDGIHFDPAALLENFDYIPGSGTWLKRSTPRSENYQGGAVTAASGVG